MYVVYVLNKKGKPLMPTVRFKHVRLLLKEKKAVAVNNNPFTIKLKYETPDIVQPLNLGIDPGRENIGLSVSDENNKCLFACKVETHNKQVTKNMQERKVHRQSRRRHRRQRLQRKALRNNTDLKTGSDDILRNKKPCKSVNISYPGMEKSITCKAIRGKEAKFNNRKVSKGWLTPSARNLIVIHKNLVRRVQEFLPISKIIIENNCFDFQKLENQDINSWEYSKGPLYGFKIYKDYIYNLQEGKCLLCNTLPIEEYHHVVQRKNNGSNNVSNIAGLCNKCHSLVHKDPNYSDLLSQYKQGLKKKYKVGILNTVYPFIIESLSEILPLKVIQGYETKSLRDKTKLDKDHHIDAYLISISKNQSKIIDETVNEKTYYIRHFKKKSNNIITKLGTRVYKLGSKIVARNRHKSFDQLEDSLEEFLDNNSNTPEERKALYSKLKVEPAKRIYTYHKNKRVLPFKCGDKVIRNKRSKSKSKKREVYITTKINSTANKIQHSSGGEAFKYCKLLESRSLVFV